MAKDITVRYTNTWGNEEAIMLDVKSGLKDIISTITILMQKRHFSLKKD